MIIRPGMVTQPAVAARHGGAAAALAERPTSTIHPQPAAAQRTVAAVPAEAPAPAAPPPAPQSDVQLPLARVQVLNGPAVGKELELRKALTTLGKPGVQVAVITRRVHGYFITQVEGPGPLVNGQAIGAQAHPLLENDVIELAGVKMEFSFID